MPLKLKEFRKSFNLSQEDLAEKLKTTQQTVQRWETGKAEPPLAALRDLSVIFGTSIDDLLGTNPFSREATTNHIVSLDKSHGNYWGHLGLRFPGEKKSRWYPITASEAHRVRNNIRDIDEKSPWLVISTLNNRMLVVNKLALKQAALLDDGEDRPEGDWELTWDGYMGLEPEVYRALGEWFEEEVDASDTFKKGLEDLIKEHELTEELVHERVLSTHIRFTDGTEQHYIIEPLHLFDAVFYAETPTGDAVVFDLSEYGGGREVYVPGSAAALIDMPLHMTIDGAKEANEDYEDPDEKDDQKDAK